MSGNICVRFLSFFHEVEVFEKKDFSKPKFGEAKAMKCRYFFEDCDFNLAGEEGNEDGWVSMHRSSKKSTQSPSDIASGSDSPPQCLAFLLALVQHLRDLDLHERKFSESEEIAGMKLQR